MRMFTRLTVLGLLAGAVPLLAQIPVEGPVETHATVSVESKQPTQLDPTKMKVQVNGITIMQTSRSAMPPPVTLQPGIPTVLGGSDLSWYVQP